MAEPTSVWRSAGLALGFVGSAVVVAWAFRSLYRGPMLPDAVFAMGSPVWLLASALVRRLRPARSNGATAMGRRGPSADRVLLWIAVLWAALALF
jgi:hypothetical protein